MDELDILKKDWNKSSGEHKKLSIKDIYPMLHKKSSSIVKTLFYISIAELIFWILVNSIPYFYSDEYKQKLEVLYSNEHILTALTVVTYGIILLFIYLLYQSYKSISVTDSAKNLMESILKTRKIIKYYVLYNLIMAGVTLIIGFYYALHNDPNLSRNAANFDNGQMIGVYALLGFIAIIFVIIIWLFYRLIYGLLLKRLNRNYTELKKLED
ncbi:hypothetical protein SAMN05428642_103417 [Flaviramulus basaltis]|uniref:Uncharacterized protein n=1 Tax=Flaviramulus basaltis TaxID=369401 RepID=A0A1K2IN80_9FLAO|nr:hypothetical protein [Flaviramulus basaltis]SFZ93917.1 hypothetical protein SAMN05428642_103417 [Flaviramulus basaltis]